MNKKGVCFCKIVAAILLTAILYVAGCQSYAQPGETEAEGQRRHNRVQQLQRQQFMRDLDRAGLVDRPSRASTLRQP